MGVKDSIRVLMSNKEIIDSERDYLEETKHLRNEETLKKVIISESMMSLICKLLSENESRVVPDNFFAETITSEGVYLTPKEVQAILEAELPFQYTISGSLCRALTEKRK